MRHLPLTYTIDRGLAAAQVAGSPLRRLCCTCRQRKPRNTAGMAAAPCIFAFSCAINQTKASFARNKQAENLLLASVAGARHSNSRQSPASPIALFGLSRPFWDFVRIRWSDGFGIVIHDRTGDRLLARLVISNLTTSESWEGIRNMVRRPPRHVAYPTAT